MNGRTGVVLLTGTGIQHRFVAGTLANGPGLDAVVVVHPVPTSRIRRLQRAHRRFGIKGMVKRAVLRGLMLVTGEERRRNRAIEEVLGDCPSSSGVPKFDVSGVNAPETLALLKRLEPEVLCVYGTPVVRDPILATARRAALNLHTGLSPRYRGAACAFWPLFHQEPQFLGATVHVCTSDVDGGAIYATGRPRMEADDGVGAVFARCVATGAELYAGVVSGILAGTATSAPQDLSEGTEFLAAMRDWRAELEVRRLLRGGLIRDYVAAGQPEHWDRRGDA